jgi:hypothetical protein
MKSSLTSLLLFATVLPAPASSIVNFLFGQAFDRSGVTVPIGTLWALIVDSNDNHTFPGGFGLNGNISTHPSGPISLARGQALALGDDVDGDTVFALGRFEDPGFATSSMMISAFGQYGLAQGRNYAFYWFPGVIYSNTHANVIQDEIGGINSALADFGAGLDPMVIPPDGSVLIQGAATVDAGGALPNAVFTAVSTVPETSTALLAAWGALGLMHRRKFPSRNDKQAPA